MSFRLFIYYCALCGGGAAFVGWAVGRNFEIRSEYLSNGVKGFWLGVTVALVLSLVEVLWSGKSRQFVSALGRVAVAVLIGGFPSALHLLSPTSASSRCPVQQRHNHASIREQSGSCHYCVHRVFPLH